jgi:glycosyltransferase involved in cell wall biosynthesis
MKKLHAFAICAYGESPYLEACIRSLKAQTVKSEIIICTSTPSDFLRRIARRYEIPIYVRTGEPGIGRDWNYAYEAASLQADLVTLAHQDDIYLRNYTETLLKMKNRYPDMSLFTTGSVTARDRELAQPGMIEHVKSLLRLPLVFPWLNACRGVKRAAITLGNPIICPSCTYDPAMCGHEPFDEEHKFVLDWKLLEKLADRDGRWIYVRKPLIIYRVHSDAATGQCIADHTREREESEMFDRLLPAPVAWAVKHLYRVSYTAYS